MIEAVAIVGTIALLVWLYRGAPLPRRIVSLSTAQPARFTQGSEPDSESEAEAPSVSGDSKGRSNPRKIPAPARERMLVAIASDSYVDEYRGPSEIVEGRTRVAPEWLDEHPEVAHCFDSAVWELGRLAETTRILTPDGDTVAGEPPLHIPPEIERNYG